MSFLRWRNRARDPRSPNEPDLHYSLAARRVLGVIGAAGMAVALAVFFWPSFYIAITPWKLTELTARILSGWTMLSFATLLSIAIDGRWSATRLLLQSAMFGQALTLLSLPRIWTDLDLANPMAFVFIGGLAAALVISAVLYAWAERRVRRGNALSTPAKM